ncbi:hypothetical protein [Actinomadura sp. WMMB 499]|uniref:hypothetical protein n=1 Tax=Actinomadura sp. WMMB 499 TaxID=1219491 RepID=UPI0012445A98|nr:hypothetical protein [Actinomadura sp. WMMB 499]QFG21316.1 hypothetical protein F7P10_09390 [Actinomadura sp. WMMB 499]
MSVAEHAAPGTGGAIPPPAADKEVVKVNAYERSLTLNSQLVPLFPYSGPGDLVACGVTMRGRPDEEFGQFFHENSQEEVAYTFGSNLAMCPPGYLIVAPRFHGVNSFLKEPHNPDAYLFQVIVQRQTEADAGPEEQREGIHIRCPECQEFLLQHVFSADPTRPQDHGGQEGDRYPAFPTVYEAVQAVDRFNGDEDIRTCGKCGHVSPPFPAATWGWHNYVRLHRAINSGRTEILAMAGRLAPAEAAS